MGVEQSIIHSPAFCGENTTSSQTFLTQHSSTLRARTSTLILDPGSNPSQINRSYLRKNKHGHVSRSLSLSKTVFVVIKDGSRIKIQFDSSEQENLTCGWLVSETIRQIGDRSLSDVNSKGSIVALQTVEGIVSLDYWLSELERPISILKDGTVLKPFYGDATFTVTDQKIDLSYFNVLKLLGTGGSSKVYLARRKDNGRFYAIKAITKKDVIMKDKEETMFNERNIMVRLNHPFLTKLHFAFQTSHQLFLVMDFFPGGELFYHLSQRRQILTEEEAKVYMGEIILALNYLHKNNIIYRDLKPENILVDIDGHLHLADFGLCKKLENKDQLTYTFCGSPEYMAPEVIRGNGYSYTADFYSLGMLVYEMVVGKPPFAWKTHRELFKQILKDEIPFPCSISPKLKLFLSQLLAKDPKERLGAKYGISEIVNHPWCANLDFVQVASKKGKTGIIPDIYQPNFAKEFLDAKITVGNEEIIDENLDNISLNLSVQSFTHRENDQTMFRKFANFSFYSNVEDPYDKYQDSIFLTNGDETARESQQMTLSTTKFDCKRKFTEDCTKCEKVGYEETNEDSKNLDKSSFLLGEACLRNYTGNFATLSLCAKPASNISLLSRTENNLRYEKPFQGPKINFVYPTPNTDYPVESHTEKASSKPSTYVTATTGIRLNPTQRPSKLLHSQTLAPSSQHYLEFKPGEKIQEEYFQEVKNTKHEPVSTSNLQKPSYLSPEPQRSFSSLIRSKPQSIFESGTYTSSQIKVNKKKINLSISMANESSRSYTGPSHKKKTKKK